MLDVLPPVYLYVGRSSSCVSVCWTFFLLCICMLDVLPPVYLYVGRSSHRYRSRSSRVPLSSRLGYRNRLNSLGFRRDRGFRDRGFDRGYSYYYNNNINNNNRFFDDNRFCYNDNQHLGRMSHGFRNRGYDNYRY
ncbi:hypothetical protein RRG08_001722 [Elysia crispata]|uniref:Uncharacterized protein n=1 Tax=Elysia crispata TaxID=231223 RepID=A0AAE1AJZ4_9GAST|nr:hypothetical protein RRG08_001722 [Elysia crispata]